MAWMVGLPDVIQNALFNCPRNEHEKEQFTGNVLNDP